MNKPKTRHVLWSGGFDSTALLLMHLRAGLKVKPYVFANSVGKQPYELQAREAILASLPKKERKLVDQIWSWDLPTAQCLPVSKAVEQAYRDHASAVGLGPQFGVIRFFQDVLGLEKLELGTIVGDEVWHRTNDTRGCAINAFGNFCRCWDFPLWGKTKWDLWNEAPERHQAILRLTWCCEHPSKKGKTCLERKTKERCSPCVRSKEIPW